MKLHLIQADGFIWASIFMHLWWAGALVIAPGFLLPYHSPLRALLQQGPPPLWAIILTGVAFMAAFAVLSHRTRQSEALLLPQQALMMFMLAEQHLKWVNEGALPETVALIMPVNTILTVGHSARILMRSRGL